MDIFKLVGSVFVDTDEANKSLSKTDEKASSVGETLTNAASKAGKFALGVGAAAAGAVASLVGVASSAASTADNIDKASQRMDISAESYQELSHAASLCGVEMSTMEKAAKQLEGTDINFDDAMASIYELETAEERSAKAAELFGETVAYNMGPMLNQSAEDFNAMKQEAHDLGLVLDEDSVKAGADLNDAMSKVKDSVTALGTNIGAALMPTITELCDQFIAFMPTLIELVDEIGPVLIDVIQKLGPPLLHAVEQILPPLIQLIEALLPLFTQICDIVLPLLTSLIDILVKLLVNVVIPAINNVVGAIKTAIDKIITTFNNLKSKISSIISTIKNAITSTIDKVVSGIRTAKNTIKSVFESMVSIIKTPINSIIGMINKMIGALNALSFDVPDWVPVLGGKTFGFNLKTIPALAEGGTVMASGQAIVGEAGAELIDLPQGARVTPLANNGNSVFDYDKMAAAVTSALLKVLPELKYDIQPDSNGIFKVVQKQAIDYTKRTGREAFA